MARKKGKKAKQEMITIKALTSFAGPAGSFAPGNEYTVPAELGQSWINSGLAEKADDLFGADEQE